MSGLVDFLLARIAEDEDRLVHEFDCDRFRTYGYGARQGDCDCEATKRLLAECEAKRCVIESVCAQWLGMTHRDEYADRNRVLQLLAMPYADHPDYPLTEVSA